MKKLYVFGCSHSELFHEDKSQNYFEYKKFKGGKFPKTWSEHLSERFDCGLINKGKGASGNDDIFFNFCKISNEINKDDIVIIQWSYMERYRWASLDQNIWVPCSANSNEPHVSKSTGEEITINRNHGLYVQAIDDYENIINSLSLSVGFQIYYWTVDLQIIEHNKNKTPHNPKYLDLDFIMHKDATIFRTIKENGGLEIIYETNGAIPDYHLGEKAHEILSNIFYEKIKKLNNKNFV